MTRTPRWDYVTASVIGRKATILSWHDNRDDADAEAALREAQTGREHTSLPIRVPGT
jgi:hypothetical protein